MFSKHVVTQEHIGGLLFSKHVVTQEHIGRTVVQ